MSLVEGWRPGFLVDCAACKFPTLRPGAGLSVFCPDCVAEIRDLESRRRDAYRLPDDAGGGRRGR